MDGILYHLHCAWRVDVVVGCLNQRLTPVDLRYVIDTFLLSLPIPTESPSIGAGNVSGRAPSSGCMRSRRSGAVPRRGQHRAQRPTPPARSSAAAAARARRFLTITGQWEQQWQQSQ